MRILKIGLVGCALALTACETTPEKPGMGKYVGSPLSVVEAKHGMWAGLHRLDKNHIAFTWTRRTRYVTSQGGTMGMKYCNTVYITEHNNNAPREDWRNFIVVDQKKKCGIIG